MNSEFALLNTVEVINFSDQIELEYDEYYRKGLNKNKRSINYLSKVKIKYLLNI